MEIKLVFLSEPNLTDRVFLRDFVHNYKFQRSIIIHEPTADVPLTRMATKRLSALLSETMTYNRAFAGDQRRLLTRQDDRILIDRARIESLLDQVQALIIGPIADSPEGPVLLNAEHLVLGLRETFGLPEIVAFPNNPLSPLVATPKHIESAADAEAHLQAYEEEREALQRAVRLRPVRFASPVNFAH